MNCRLIKLFYWLLLVRRSKVKEELRAGGDVAPLYWMEGTLWRPGTVSERVYLLDFMSENLQAVSAFPSTLGCFWNQNRIRHKRCGRALTRPGP